MTEPTPADLDGAMRTAHGRGRLDPAAAPADTPPPEVPAEDTGPTPFADMPADELEKLIHDRATRREVLTDPGVRRRLALADPDIRERIEAAEARARAAEARAEAKLAALDAGKPRPQPLPGGGAAPTHDTGVSPDRMIRAAVRKARGEGTGDRNAAAMVDGHGTGAASFRVGQ